MAVDAGKGCRPVALGGDPARLLAGGGRDDILSGGDSAGTADLVGSGILVARCPGGTDQLEGRVSGPS